MLETFSLNGEMVISKAAYLENRSLGLVGSQEVFSERKGPTWIAQYDRT
jgi:hypothetical protein